MSSSSHHLVSSVRATMLEYAMVAPGERVVVAVSGGPDSSALLLTLAEILEADRLVAVHVDHGLRPDSAGEAALVADLARRCGAGFEAVRVQVARSGGDSLQEVAREQRYAALEGVADRIGAHRVATGHTADDQAETVLMRLVRGSGPAGLGGIPPVRGRFIRPLLGATRAQVMDYLHSRKVDYLEDPSNRSPRFTRNRVRHEILPLLRSLNPAAGEALAHAAHLLAQDEAFLQQLADRELERCLGEEGLGVAALRTLHPALRDRVLRTYVERARGHLRGLGRSHWAGLLRLCHGEDGGYRRLDLPGGWEAVCFYGQMRIRREMNQCSGSFYQRLAVPCTVRCPEAGVTVQVSAGPPSMARGGSGASSEWFDAALLPAPLAIRSPRPGDRFRPFGMAGTKKLHDFFVDCKVPRDQRSKVPLVVAGEEIIWVVGMRRGSVAPIGPNTRQALRIDATALV